ncbi:hypothetical protein J1N35_021645 [Gossypium stocksii]|uniref:non-specific serine/threonine protein kinase n=1 Tax=Gossypium stocksii TaxID=47602 RepID=A0A9D3VGA7_9ROSI|nr:hypothetical protein J1N35_021645 [Gossypium stocksii]
MTSSSSELALLLLSLSFMMLGVAASQSNNTRGARPWMFTIVNNCSYTVWPGVLTTDETSQRFPTTGFSLRPSESTSISIPRSWRGRIWGRTLCTQDSSGNFSCLTGDCGTSRPECSGNSSIQATLAEFGFNDDLGDFYDVSLVGGYNLPLMISPHGGTGGDCNSTACVADLNGDCPSELKVVNGSETVACKSACSALGEPQYCCTGDYGSPATCQPTSYSQFFKTACPTAYSYTFDDATSMFTCVDVDYDITFCPTTFTSPDQLYEKCRDAVFKCGNISIGYPFSGGDRDPECGHPGLNLHCDVFTNTTRIEIVGVKYEVLDIHHESRILRIAREDFIKNGSCHPQIPIQDSILNSEPFVLGSGNTNLTLSYDCQSSSSLGIFPCNSSNYNNVSITTDNIRPDGCAANVRVPILQSSWGRLRNDSLDLEEALETGFEVQWKEDTEACRKCNASGGACGFDKSNNQTFCYCPSGFESSPGSNECHRALLPPSPTNTGNNNTRGGSKSKLKLTPIIIGSVVGVVSISTICFIVLRFKGKLLSNYLRQGKMNDDARIEEFITKFGRFAPKRYSYEEIKKMTNKFNDKLGQGGFGSVYKGRLSNGHLVAVKFLSETKGNGEDFMNEVASISRTSHVNIVTLLGFCFERSKRALIYEFMPKGSLDKFIYSQGSDNRNRQLEWITLYDIALGIARGLEYLHQGCNTRILHFDIKPHNILLDENFCPKISDFGLSKLCERKESVVSMTGARGTAGYIAPEVFFRNLGGVSHKSDVYSYGMMVLEMVGGRKNINVEVSQTSEIYFPSWIYKHLDQSMNLNSNEERTKEEEEITKKLIAVSLWCIQTNPLDRPPMAKVIEMLQGSLQSLDLLPRPT